MSERQVQPSGGNSARMLKAENDLLVNKASYVSDAALFSLELGAWLNFHHICPRLSPSCASARRWPAPSNATQDSPGQPWRGEASRSRGVRTSSTWRWTWGRWMSQQTQSGNGAGAGWGWGGGAHCAVLAPEARAPPRNPENARAAVPAHPKQAPRTSGVP